VRLTLGAGTKQGQLSRLGANDFLPADRSQPSQCSQKHRSDYRRGKQRSRCNAIHHGLTAETVIGALEDAENYKAFEAAVIADYDAQSAVERELVLRLASLLWRLRRATTMETGLLEIQAEHLSGFKQAIHPASREVVYALFGRADSVSFDRDPELHRIAIGTEVVPSSVSESVGSAVDLTAELAHCFLRLANLPYYALDRLSRYEATLWRQAGQILFALDALDRRKPQDRRSRFHVSSRQEVPAYGRDEY
jgi:hypothetical protein